MFRLYFHDYLRNLKERPLAMFFSFICVVIGVFAATVFYLYTVYASNGIPTELQSPNGLRNYRISVEDFVKCDHRKLQEYILKYDGHVASGVNYDEKFIILSSVTVDNGFTEEELLSGENVIIISQDFIEEYGEYAPGDKLMVKGIEFTVKKIGSFMYAPFLSDLFPEFMDSISQYENDLRIASLCLPLEYNIFERPALERELNARLHFTNGFVALLSLIIVSLCLVVIFGVVADILFLSVMKRSAYRYFVYRLNGASVDDIVSCMAFSCIVNAAAGILLTLPSASAIINWASEGMINPTRVVFMNILITIFVVISMTVPLMVFFHFKGFKSKFLEKVWLE